MTPGAAEILAGKGTNKEWKKSLLAQLGPGTIPMDQLLEQYDLD
jgi:hypothetical protein